MAADCRGGEPPPDGGGSDDIKKNAATAPGTSRVHERTGDKKCSSQVPWLRIVLSIIELLFLAECALCFLCMLREGKYICLCTLLAAGADSARLSESRLGGSLMMHC